MSYNTRSNYEFIGRYSIQKVGKDIETKAPNTKEFSFGVTKYIWEHSFKLQSEITLDKLDFYNGTSKENWYVRFQVEIGI